MALVQKEVKGWLFTERISGGYFSTVYKTQKIIKSGATQTVAYAAAKVMDLRQMAVQKKQFGLSDHEMYGLMKNEARILRSLDHPNIVSYVDATVVDNGFYIFTELIHGRTLVNLIPGGGFSEARGRMLFSQLAEAVNYLHSRQILHGDIKPENILIHSKDWRLKLIDFGFAQVVEGQKQPKAYGGTLMYSPPEGTPSFAWDCWSCGVVLFALLTCGLPFDEQTVHSRGKCPLRFPSQVSIDAVDLISGLLTFDHNARWTIKQVVSSKFLYQQQQADSEAVFFHGSPSVLMSTPSPSSTAQRDRSNSVSFRNSPQTISSARSSSKKNLTASDISDGKSFSTTTRFGTRGARASSTSSATVTNRSSRASSASSSIFFWKS
mmetsp:Transcript_5899/g.7742  ORF Transcript_5899/g.7742 Transcript_5899/m.7742 type:complete len:379 (-) Transcript_5899:927-2063(-)